MIYQLETTGEEVGMTWRSLLAAGVCSPSHRYQRCEADVIICRAWHFHTMHTSSRS
jgi:hypothetical protein